MIHFRVSTPSVITTGALTRQEELPNPTTDIGVNRVYPFDTLAIDAQKLQELLAYRT
jgi:hypothetical protein